MATSERFGHALRPALMSHGGDEIMPDLQRDLIDAFEALEDAEDAGKCLSRQALAALASKATKAVQAIRLDDLLTRWRLA
jgi:hypothetical protein